MVESMPLDPKVKISDLDMSELPLYNFHVVVLAEPDPETWVMPDDEKFSQLLEMYSELIINDVIGDAENLNFVPMPRAEDVKETIIIMAGEDMVIDFFKDLEPYSRYVVKSDNYEFENLRVLLDGIAKNNPTWTRIGIVGGVYEDEVVRVANAIQAAGFDTTIVKRHCISEDIFINLDNVWDAINAERKRILGERGQLDEDNDFDVEAA